MQKLRKEIKKNLPKGFQEGMTYGMIGYVIPHSLYPKGYHCDPKQALPFINIASQKNFVAFYHMGLYAKLVLDLRKCKPFRLNFSVSWLLKLQRSNGWM